MQNVAHGAKHVERANQQPAPKREAGHKRENFPCAEEYGDFADEIRKARQAAAGHRRHEQRRADEPQLAAKPAQPAHFQRAGFLVNVAAQRERQRRKEAVRNHDEHRAGHADEVQAGDAEENEAHVRHTRIADEQVQILLPHCHPADVKNVAEAEPGEKSHPVVCGLRHQRQRDANQAVKPEFLQHAGVQHGGRRRGGAVAQRRPRMERPERNQNAEAEQQQREDEILRATSHRIVVEKFS